MIPDLLPVICPLILVDQPSMFAGREASSRHRHDVCVHVACVELGEVRIAISAETVATLPDGEGEEVVGEVNVLTEVDLDVLLASLGQVDARTELGLLNTTGLALLGVGHVDIGEFFEEVVKVDPELASLLDNALSG
jgi:hypothetical protein